MIFLFSGKQIHLQSNFGNRAKGPIAQLVRAPDS
jgi:hypothetical protein